MPNTKDFVPIETVTNDVAILKDGTVVMVVQTSAVNFDLLSEGEQLAIIGSFAGFLNSLSFSIQILIRSKKLDISHYLKILKEAEIKQFNPLLQMMMQRYRAFVEAIIRDNEVLDKQFYVVFSVSSVELGIVKSQDALKNITKALTILGPRREHILKQLSRIGLKSTQLNDEKLIRLFYDTYNDDNKISLAEIQNNPANATPASQSIGNKRQEIVKNIQSGSALSQTQLTPPPQLPTPSEVVAQSRATTPSATPGQAPLISPQPLASTKPPLYSSSNSVNHSPFVVEELPG